MRHHHIEKYDISTLKLARDRIHARIPTIIKYARAFSHLKNNSIFSVLNVNFQDTEDTRNQARL